MHGNSGARGQGVLLLGCECRTFNVKKENEETCCRQERNGSCTVSRCEEDNTGKTYTRAGLFVETGIRLREGGEGYCNKILK